VKIFPDELSPEEKKAGFSRQKVKTGYGTLAGDDEEVFIVIKPISETRRYIKVEEGYMLQKLDRPNERDQLNSWAPTQGLPVQLEDVQ
jgi:hypothetical protein